MEWETLSEELRRMSLGGDGMIVIMDDGMTEMVLFSKDYDDYNPGVVFPTQKLRDFFNGVYQDETFVFKPSGTYR